MQFNHGIKHERLIVKSVFGGVQKGCRLEEVQEWKTKDKMNLLQLWHLRL
jgi:hypothetical protein